MAFPWFTLGMAAVGGISSLFGSSSRNRATDARNKERKQQYQNQEEWNLAQYSYGEKQSDVAYAWDMAKFTALQYTEKQKKLDYEFLQGNQIDTTIKNLDLNIQALGDQYIVAEDLRAQQTMLDMGLTTNTNVNKLAQTEIRANDLASQAQLNMIQSQTEIANYLLDVQSNANAQNQIMQQQDQEINDLLSSIATDVMVEKFEQDLTMVASMVEEGQISARSNARLGGTSSSRQLAMNTAKALGRTYGQMKINQQERNNRVAQQNLANKGNAMRMYDVALNTARVKNAAQLSVDTGRIRNDQLQNAFSGVRLDAEQINTEQTYAEDVYTDLTVPGFELANNQGKRELEALNLNAFNDLVTVGMPYRDPILFEPQRALPGLRPYSVGPTMEAKESLGATLGGAVIGAAQGAMKGAYKTDGKLSFL